MSAVGEIHQSPVLVRKAQQLAEEIEDPGPGRRSIQVHSLRGLPSHEPSRMLNAVIRNAVAGEVKEPIFGLTAAPEIAIALPRYILPP